VVNLVSGSREDTEALLDVTKPGGIESRKAPVPLVPRTRDILLTGGWLGRSLIPSLSRSF